MTELPKYTRLEVERRFLVDARRASAVLAGPRWRIEDRYLDGGRLRLRRMTHSVSGEVVMKLAKKFASDSPLATPLVNVYLDEAEFAALAVLPGACLSKERFHDTRGDARWGIDVFEGELRGLVLCEAEAPSAPAVLALTPPPYAASEVTTDPFFTGGVLCRADRSELAAALGRHGRP